MGPSQQEARDLTEKGVEKLRARLRSKLKGDPSIGAAVDGVLRAIENGWDDSSGQADADAYRAMVDALAPELEALLELPSRDAKAAADRLVEKWERVRVPLGW